MAYEIAPSSDGDQDRVVLGPDAASRATAI